MFKKKPFFIVFEGVEGCGKSYQSKKLFNKLKKYKIKTILTREPGGTKSSELIRNLILKDYFNKNTKDKSTLGDEYGRKQSTNIQIDIHVFSSVAVFAMNPQIPISQLRGG